MGDIARAVEASEEQVLEALEAMGAYRASSLDVPRSAREEESESVAETLGSPDHGYDRAEERATLAPLMARITERERTVLRLRFRDDLTQAEIGERIGVSQMQVSRLIRQALARLRAGVDADPPSDSHSTAPALPRLGSRPRACSRAENASNPSIRTLRSLQGSMIGLDFVSHNCQHVPRCQEQCGWGP